MILKYIRCPQILLFILPLLTQIISHAQAKLTFNTYLQDTSRCLFFYKICPISFTKQRTIALGCASKPDPNLSNQIKGYAQYSLLNSEFNLDPQFIGQLEPENKSLNKRGYLGITDLFDLPYVAFQYFQNDDNLIRIAETQGKFAKVKAFKSINEASDSMNKIYDSSLIFVGNTGDSVEEKIRSLEIFDFNLPDLSQAVVIVLNATAARVMRVDDFRYSVFVAVITQDFQLSLFDRSYTKLRLQSVFDRQGGSNALSTKPTFYNADQSLPGQSCIALVGGNTQKLLKIENGNTVLVEYQVIQNGVAYLQDSSYFCTIGSTQELNVYDDSYPSSYLENLHFEGAYIFQDLKSSFQNNVALSSQQKGVIAVQILHTPSQDDKSFSFCKPGCQSCQGPQCLQCFSNSFLVKEKNECQECDSSCSTCSGPGNSNCLECNVLHFKTENKTSCVSECPDGQFNSTLTQCSSCQETCKKCSGTQINQCLQCYEDRSLFTGNMTCLERCPDNYFSLQSNFNETLAKDSVKKEFVCDQCLQENELCDHFQIYGVQMIDLQGIAIEKMVNGYYRMLLSDFSFLKGLNGLLSAYKELGYEPISGDTLKQRVEAYIQVKIFEKNPNNGNEDRNEVNKSFYKVEYKLNEQGIDFLISSDLVYHRHCFIQFHSRPFKQVLDLTPIKPLSKQSQKSAITVKNMVLRPQLVESAQVFRINLTGSVSQVKMISQVVSTLILLIFLIFLIIMAITYYYYSFISKNKHQLRNFIRYRYLTLIKPIWMIQILNKLIFLKRKKSFFFFFFFRQFDFSLDGLVRRFQSFDSLNLVKYRNNDNFDLYPVSPLLLHNLPVLTTTVLVVQIVTWITQSIYQSRLKKMRKAMSNYSEYKNSEALGQEWRRQQKLEVFKKEVERTIKDFSYMEKVRNIFLFLNHIQYQIFVVDLVFYSALALKTSLIADSKFINPQSSFLQDLDWVIALVISIFTISEFFIYWIDMNRVFQGQNAYLNLNFEKESTSLRYEIKRHTQFPQSIKNFTDVLIFTDYSPSEHSSNLEQYDYIYQILLIICTQMSLIGLYTYPLFCLLFNFILFFTYSTMKIHSLLSRYFSQQQFYSWFNGSHNKQFDSSFLAKLRDKSNADSPNYSRVSQFNWQILLWSLVNLMVSFGFLILLREGPEIDGFMTAFVILVLLLNLCYCICGFVKFIEVLLTLRRVQKDDQEIEEFKQRQRRRINMGRLSRKSEMSLEQTDLANQQFLPLQEVENDIKEPLIKVDKDN